MLKHAEACLSKLAAAEQLKLKFEDELHGFQLLDEASRGLLTSQLLLKAGKDFQQRCASLFIIQNAGQKLDA